MKQPHNRLLSIRLPPGAEEAPRPAAAACEIPSHEPPLALPWMPPQGPAPECFEDGAINAAEDARALDVAMVQRPAANHAVEFGSQPPCWSIQRFFHMGSHLFKERMDVLLGRFDPQLSMGVATQILAEEVEAFLNVRDLRLFRREFQPTFAQEALHQRRHLILQQFFRSAGDDEVVGIADQMNLCLATVLRALPEPWVSLP